MDADAKAREINARIHADCQAPYCGCKDRLCGVSENYIAAALREVERETVERCARAQCDHCTDGKPVTRVPIPHDGPDACRWMHLRADNPRVGWECEAAAIRALVDERRAEPQP